MRTLLSVFVACGLCFVGSSALWAGDGSEQDVSRVLPDGSLPADARLGKLRDLRDAYHPWVPPNNMEDWELAAEAIRERLLVSTGLWPMPPKTPLSPVVHGKIDRGDYSVEKVFFASHPGHYVTGNLYRPTGKEGKLPGVLCPHGHWPNGRFHDAGEDEGREQLEIDAEQFMSGARAPIQARLVHLARMGCVVFHYDMVGYADSRQIDHREGFSDAAAGLWLQNFMGLQTFNSMRGLDFLCGLPEVDTTRIAVTGSSGGGTQTFMLCALDPRPVVAFPAVMVSTAMQGGCICENAPYLRQGINNVAMAALFAPKPMALSGADDWTIDIETKGLPELRQVYSLYGQGDLVFAKAFPQFGHNYNHVARQMMYGWVEKHLGLEPDQPMQEHDFWPLTAVEMSVFDEDHPLPDDAQSVTELRQYLTDVSELQYADLIPAEVSQLAEYRRVVGKAARVLLDGGISSIEKLESEGDKKQFDDDLILMKGLIGRPGAGEQIPVVGLIPVGFGGSVVVWIDGQGKSHLFDEQGQPTAPVRKLLDSGRGVISADVFLTGEFVADGQQAEMPEINEEYHGYTFGYNRPVLSNRVRDVLTVVHAALAKDTVASVELVGTGKAGAWVLLAAGLTGDGVRQVVVDLQGSGFRNVSDVSDPMFLPGALRYGGIGGLGALAAPRMLSVAGLRSVAPQERQPLAAVYKAAGGKLTQYDDPLTPHGVVEELLR